MAVGIWFRLPCSVLVLRLNGDGPESSAAIEEMRRAKQVLKEFEINYEEHRAKHANSARMWMVS